MAAFLTAPGGRKMFEKIYELPINKEYVRHWGMNEAIRELIQNAIDSDSPFEWTFTNDRLRLRSKHSTLTPDTLLLGTTTKAEDGSKIGNFGEGYKIAMLVLTREDYKVVIHNGDVTWSPEFRLNKKFGAETLHIVEQAGSTSNIGVTFEVNGLTHSDIEEIKESCLWMQDTIGEFKSTQYGDILIEQPGKLYVGGLFITTTEMDYGYDIKPEYIKLERDRQTVDNFDLRTLTKDMWFETEEYDKIAELMEAGIEDLDLADWNTPELVKESCYQRFIVENPGATVASSNTELNEMVEAGLTKVVYVHGGYGSTIKDSTSYKANSTPVKPKAHPPAVMQQFYGNNKKYMKRAAQVEFKKLIEASQEWSNR